MWSMASLGNADVTRGLWIPNRDNIVACDLHLDRLWRIAVGGRLLVLDYLLLLSVLICER